MLWACLLRSGVLHFGRSPYLLLCEFLSLSWVEVMGMEALNNFADANGAVDGLEWNFLRPSLELPRMSSWFDVRVFYVRISCCEIDDSTPEFLTLNHIPLSPDTFLEINGRRSGLDSDCVSLPLRRDRVDKKSLEATFVSTDSVRMGGSVRFEVFLRNDLFLSGVLQLCDANGISMRESSKHTKLWKMDCQWTMTVLPSFLKGKSYTMVAELVYPTVEVYVAGSYSGEPVILTKTLKLNSQKKHSRKGKLDSIPENETHDINKNFSSQLAPQATESSGFTQDDEDEDYKNFYSGEYLEGEDGELTWFNAGVRVGVGIGLGICLGVGIGVGVLVRTYQATSRRFRRR